MRRLAAALLVTAALVTAPTGAAVVGPLRIVVVPVTWGPRPLDDSQVQQLTAEAATFLRNASFGQLTLAADVTPWLRAFASPPRCTDLRLIHDTTAREAAAAGYDIDRYSRRIYLLPYDEPTCGAAGPIAYTVGRDTVDTRLFESETIAHELGHTIGLGHARRTTCLPACVTHEYGDPYDTMALGSGDFNPLEKALAGWLPVPAVAQHDGDFVVDQFERPSTLPQALVVPTGRGEYWIDHRERLGNDGDLLLPVGIEVRLRKPAILGESLILTPSVLVSDPHDLNGGAVPIGATFSVPGVFSLTALDHVGTHVDLRFRWLDRTAPARAAPKQPASTAGGLKLAWDAAVDRGSGIDHYDVFLDGGSVAPTSATSEIVPQQARGRHTLVVVAVDRAGNRGPAASRRFVLRY